MSVLSLAFFGDIVGLPGIRAFEHAARILRESGRADLIAVNAENARGGSGLAPDGYKIIRRAGADAITLGDHCFKDRRICDLLDDPEKPISRPANLATGARGKRSTFIQQHEPEPGTTPATTAPSTPLPPLHIITVLGRLYMSLPANDPFETVDREITTIITREPDALIIIEVHAEATSEKQAMAWYCLKQWPHRVVAVVGTHTHVQTADARILDNTLAAITDLGMCGGHRGIIGRKIEPVLEVMTRQNPLMYDVADEDLRANGALITIDTAARVALAIELIQIQVPQPVAS